MTSTTVGDMKRLYHQLHLHGGLAQEMKSRTQNVHDVLCWYYIKRKCRGWGGQLFQLFEFSSQHTQMKHTPNFMGFINHVGLRP